MGWKEKRLHFYVQKLIMAIEEFVDNHAFVFVVPYVKIYHKELKIAYSSKFVIGTKRL